MHKTNQNTPAEIQAPTAHQPNEGQITPGCGEKQGEEQTKIIWETEPDGTKNGDSATRHCTYSQYGPQSNSAGKYCWQVRIVGNWRACVSAIVETAEQAHEMCELHAAMTDSEIIEAAAREHLEYLNEMGYQPRTSVDYAIGYSNGYSAALAKLQTFIDNEQPKEE